MWRSVLWRSRNLVAAARVAKKEAQSLPRVSHLASSTNASVRNFRFFSTVPTEKEDPIGLTHEESSVSDLGFPESGDFDVKGTSAEAIGEDRDSEIVTGEEDPISSSLGLTHEESSVSDSSSSESSDSDVNGGTSVQAIDENGDSEIVTSEDGSIVEDVDSEVNEVYQFDDEKFESVLSLLRSDGESLEFGLEEIDLYLHLDFVSKVLQSPRIPGENLIRFLKWSIKKEEVIGITPLLESLVLAISSNASQTDASALWDFVKEIGEKEQNSCVLNLEIMNELIALFGKLNEPESAFDVFSKAEEFGLTLNENSYFLTLEAICKRSYMDWACSVCEKMLESGLLPKEKQIGKIITRFCEAGKAEEAYSVYEMAKTKEKSPRSKPLATLISALCKNAGNVTLARDLLDDLSDKARRYGIKPFTDVLRNLCKMGDVKDCKTLLLDMVSRGPPPGNAVFNLVIHACSRNGDLDEAKEVLKLMECRGLRPDVYTYTVMISGYAKGGMMKEAQDILEEAKKRHEKLLSVTYHPLIRGYCKMEEYDEALRVLKEMGSSGVQPNANEYSMLIQSFCLKALDWEKAEMLYEEMKQKGLHLDTQTQALIRAVKEMESEAKGSENGTLLAAA